MYVFISYALLCIIEDLFIYSRNGIRRTSTRIQLVSIVTLYVSTCIYFAVSIPFYANIYAWDTVYLHTPFLPLPTPKWGEDVQRAQSILFTATLTVNVSVHGPLKYLELSAATSPQIFVADAIVWWRACAVWPKNYYVRAGCVVILGATLGKPRICTSQPRIVNVLMRPISPYQLRAVWPRMLRESQTSGLCLIKGLSCTR